MSVNLLQFGAFHLIKNPGLNFRNFRMLNGTVFSTRRTDLVLFPLEHISHQELLEKMLQDRDEVAVLSAILSCFVKRSLKSILNSILP